jgi:hypothetical protein
MRMSYARNGLSENRTLLIETAIVCDSPLIIGHSVSATRSTPGALAKYHWQEL